MRSFSVWSLVVFLIPGAVIAQEGYKVEVLKQPVSASVAPEVAAALNPVGIRIIDDQGKPYADLWLRKSIPASAKPAGPKGTILFPFLNESELLGVMEFASEGHDYRDQSIAKGAYTMRYGLQPVNGDHLGVSPYRDYSLLLSVTKDKSLAILPRKQLENQSSEAAGTSHPAVFLMGSVTEASAKSAPSMIHDAEKNTWSVVLPLNLQIKGETAPTVFHLQLIVVGASAS